MQQPEPVLMHRLQVLCEPELIALIDDLRRNADGEVPSRAEVVRSALQEKAARDLNGRKHKDKS
jgi:hypothetical protein